MDMYRNVKRNFRLSKRHLNDKKALLPDSLGWHAHPPLPYLFCKSKCGWQFQELCLKTQRQEMFPGALTSTCSVMDADASTSTLAAS